MKVIVVSDNHGDTYFMEEILSIHAEDTDAWFHCGDSELPEYHPLFQRYQTVEGNMDFAKNLKISRVEEVHGEKFLIAHGHKHNVKRSYNQLKEEAMRVGSRFVFYGHTHIAKVEEEDGVFFINPGSITQPRDRDKGTYLVLTIDGEKGTVFFNFYDEDHNSIPELNQQRTLS